MASEVATKKNAELSTDLMDDILEFAGEGAAFGADEMQIPFIRALQALSPQLNKKRRRSPFALCKEIMALFL